MLENYQFSLTSKSVFSESYLVISIPEDIKISRPTNCYLHMLFKSTLPASASQLISWPSASKISIILSTFLGILLEYIYSGADLVGPGTNFEQQGPSLSFPHIPPLILTSLLTLQGSLCFPALGGSHWQISIVLVLSIRDQSTSLRGKEAQGPITVEEGRTD